MPQDQPHPHQPLHDLALEYLGKVSGNVAHDLNNVLAAIAINADLIASSLSPESSPRVSEALNNLKSAITRGNAAVKQLASFSGWDLHPRPTSLRSALNDLITVLRELVPGRIEISVELEPDLPLVQIDPLALEQILLQLAKNAIDAIPGNGLFSIEARKIAARPDRVSLRISDNGIGMSGETIQRAFEPFFSTKPSASGLGLAVVKNLAHRQQGEVWLQSALDNGTSVYLEFPVGSATRTRPSASATEGLGGTETLLFIEDDEPLREGAKLLLEKFGYHALTAADGAEAIQIFREHGSKISLVISDFAMPKLSGDEFYLVLQQLNKNVKFLFVSGYSAKEVRELAALGHDVPFISKPWTGAELLEKIRAILDA